MQAKTKQISVDSPTLTAAESGKLRAQRGLTLPAGASREMVAGYYAELCLYQEKLAKISDSFDKAAS